MKRWLIALLALAPFSEIYGGEAKRYELRDLMVFAGATLSRYSPITGWVPIPELRLDQNNRLGAAAGIGYEVPLNKRIMIDVGLFYVSKGTKVDLFMMDEPIGGWAYRLHCLSNSALFKFKLRPGTSPYALAGYDLSWIFSYRIAGTPDAPDPMISGPKDIDFGFIAGAGVEYGSQKWIPFAEVRYHFGLLNVSRGIENSAPLRTRALLFLAGFKIRLKEQ